MFALLLTLIGACLLSLFLVFDARLLCCFVYTLMGLSLHAFETERVHVRGMPVGDEWDANYVHCYPHVEPSLVE